MTTLYRPVLIETQEQAEALPVGTMAVLWHVPWIGELIDPAAGEFAWQSKTGAYSHSEMLGTTALVPIEAEEEALSRSTVSTPLGNAVRALVGTRSTELRRLVTPWEEAS